MPNSQIITQKIIEIRGHKVLLDTEIEQQFATPVRLKARVQIFIKH